MLATRCLVQAVMLLSLVWAAGCSKAPPEAVPELSPVSGVVKLDGKALEGATVVFTTKAGTSAGTTDVNGKYVLKYRDTLDGGPVGANVVRIIKYKKDEAPDGTEVVGISLVPSQFNDNTSLSSDVKPKTPNEQNFDLKSR